MKPLAQACALAFSLTCPTASLADPAFGFGITVLTGGDATISLRVFSDNRRYKPAASFGIDYKLESDSFRPALGAAYLDRNAYVDVTVGVDIQTGALDFGIGTGKLWNSQGPAVAPAPPPPQPGGGTDIN